VPCSSRSEISQLRNYKFVKGNLLSADLIKYVLETEEIDTIIHAAAQVRLAPPLLPPPPP
jgi:UDP-glucose 4,6-dehydratase